MSNNYIVINGKKAELTMEQMKALGIEVRKSPFDRVDDGRPYYFIDSFDEVHCVAEYAAQDDDMSFKCSNYFNDEAFAKQVALRQLLYRKLLKFAYENGYEDVEWDNKNTHWCIFYSHVNLKYEVVGFVFRKFADVWFSSEEGAKRAIKEVVEPFMKEHPEFVW